VPRRQPRAGGFLIVPDSYGGFERLRPGRRLQVRIGVSTTSVFGFRDSQMTARTRTRATEEEHQAMATWTRAPDRSGRLNAVESGQAGNPALSRNDTSFQADGGGTPCSMRMITPGSPRLPKVR
jgi:hypothetical protein